MQTEEYICRLIGILFLTQRTYLNLFGARFSVSLNYQKQRVVLALEKDQRIKIILKSNGTSLIEYRRKKIHISKEEPVCSFLTHLLSVLYPRSDY